MNYVNFIEENNIDIKVLQELNLVEKFEEIFNDTSISDAQKKQAAKDLFLESLVTVEKILHVKNENSDGEVQVDEDQEEDDDISDFSDLILKPSKIKGVKIQKIENEIDGDIALNAVKEDPFYKVSDIAFTKLSFKPRKPFITSTLQQAGSSFLGINPKLTMSLAQKLYEGVEINGEQTALITYMRTDSFNLSSFAVDQIRDYLKMAYPNFLPAEKREYRSKSKNSQEAHEAIRPTNIFISPQSLAGKIDRQLWRLYDLIWKNTVACQMTDQIKEKKSFNLVNSQDSAFSGSFITVIENGWREVFNFDK